MSISLQGSLRTCKVNVGYANRIQSDRFFNPNNQVCPVWNGMDTAGRPVCPNSFYTKVEGCNSAADRVLVENYLRPNYAEYLTLNTQGYGSRNKCTHCWSSMPTGWLTRRFLTNWSFWRTSKSSKYYYWLPIMLSWIYCI